MLQPLSSCQSLTEFGEHEVFKMVPRSCFAENLGMNAGKEIRIKLNHRVEKNLAHVYVRSWVKNEPKKCSTVDADTIARR